MNKTCFCGGNLFEIIEDKIYCCVNCGHIHDEDENK